MKPSIETVKAFTVAALPEVIGLAAALYGIDLKPTTRITTRAARSHGNHLNVSINLGYYYKHINAEGIAYYWEYKHIAADREIGSFHAHWTKQIMALLAHEVAHAVQMAFSNKSTDAEVAASIARHAGKAQDYIGRDAQAMYHAENWQSIYRDLRSALGLVNLPE